MTGKRITPIHYRSFGNQPSIKPESQQNNGGSDNTQSESPRQKLTTLSRISALLGNNIINTIS